MQQSRYDVPVVVYSVDQETELIDDANQRQDIGVEALRLKAKP
jgi:hypothetical protein